MESHHYTGSFVTVVMRSLHLRKCLKNPIMCFRFWILLGSKAAREEKWPAGGSAAPGSLPVAVWCQVSSPPSPHYVMPQTALLTNTPRNAGDRAQVATPPFVYASVTEPESL